MNQWSGRVQAVQKEFRMWWMSSGHRFHREYSARNACCCQGPTTCFVVSHMFFLIHPAPSPHNHGPQGGATYCRLRDNGAFWILSQVVVLVLDGTEGMLRKTELTIAAMGTFALCRCPLGTFSRADDGSRSLLFFSLPLRRLSLGAQSGTCSIRDDTTTRDGRGMNDQLNSVRSMCVRLPILAAPFGTFAYCGIEL